MDNHTILNNDKIPENKIIEFPINKRIQLSKHFNCQNFKCRCGKSNKILVNQRLIYLLEEIYSILNCSKIQIINGYRCPGHDRELNNPFINQHRLGNAVDIIFYDKNKKVISTKRISCLAQDLGFSGISNITNSYSSIHLDLGNTKNWKTSEFFINGKDITDFYQYYNLTKSDVYNI